MKRLEFISSRYFLLVAAVAGFVACSEPHNADPLSTTTTEQVGNSSSEEAPAPQYIDYVMPEVTASAADGYPTKTDSIGAVIKGKKVAVIEDALYDSFIEHNYPEAEVLPYDDSSGLIQAMLTDKVDLMLHNEIGARLIKMSYPSLEVLFNGFEKDYICFGVNKNNPELLEELNSFLVEYNKDGGIDEIVNRWIDQLGNGRLKDFGLSGDCERTLRVGTSASSTPYTFIADGELEGADIEILSLFCKYAGYNLEIIRTPLDSLIIALTTGKVDLIADGVSQTAERAEMFNLSIPYSTIDLVLATNRDEISPDANIESYKDRLTTSFHNNILRENRYKMIIRGLWVTIKISLLSIIFGTILGMLLCYMSMRRSRILRKVANGYITVIRGVPVLVLIMMNYYVIFAATDLTPLTVAVISFSLNFAASVSEMFRTAIESVDKGQSEAGLAMGFSKIRTFMLIVVPQALDRVMPIYKGGCIALMKTTSVVGYIAVEDITKVSNFIRSRTFDAFFPIIVSALIYFLLAYILTKTLDLLMVKKR